MTPTITLINPCQQVPTVLDAKTLGNQNVVLDAASATVYAVGDFTDSVSTSLAPSDGTTFCGARSFTFSDPVLVQDVGGGTWEL